MDLSSQQSPKDSLTKFFLRESLGPYLDRLLIEAKTKEKKFSLVLIDLDHFKKYNDKYGHTFGDEILKYATSTIRLTFQDSQCSFFRYGGDEFIIVFPDMESKDLLTLMKRCNYNMSHRPFLFSNKFYKISMSCGIAGYPQDATAVKDLIKKADIAMYFSKRHGRNNTVLASKIKFLKLRRIFLLVLSIILITVFSLLLYKFAFNNTLQSSINKIKSLKIITKPRGLDRIFLKTGGVFEGRIISEAGEKVILNLYFDNEEGTITLNKSEIAEIKYGPGK